MSEVKKRSAVAASISVPPKDQDEFSENKQRMMLQFAKILGESESRANSIFSQFVRLVVNTGTIEERDGESYLIVKMSL